MANDATITNATFSRPMVDFEPALKKQPSLGIPHTHIKSHFTTGHKRVKVKGHSLETFRSHLVGVQGRGGIAATNSQPWHWIGVSGQHHALPALCLNHTYGDKSEELETAVPTYTRQ
ncbi:hypothetical protein L798_04737 [Zootermopsis nevadensis]|uniref:Uncharacterized protein n=1 Tax=Zootermopsis nevadensis TaxID=136037 RepID=A0A067RAM1_ZOONE|nr:hypothetical protein L798_04737 [Zootermopsis nevadensis]